MKKFISHFNEEAESLQKYLSIARDSSLQRDAIQRAKDLKTKVSKEKSDAVSNKDGDYANRLLGCEYACNMLIEELKMWLRLKEESPNEAWDCLIDAQMASTNAVRAHDSFSHFEEHRKRLLAIEKLVFPPQVFFSSGMIVHEQECSICGQEYEECEHLIGKPYMGEMCYVIARDFEIDHISVVEEPADKHCRAKKFTIDGTTRDRMTWQIVQKSQT